MLLETHAEGDDASSGLLRALGLERRRAVARDEVSALVAGSVVAVVDRLGASTPPRPGPVTAPSLTTLNAAIAREVAPLLR